MLFKIKYSTHYYRSFRDLEDPVEGHEGFLYNTRTCEQRENLEEKKKKEIRENEEGK